jgi:hypothetical protein
MLTLLQASCAVAVPVALGAVLAPHSNVTFGGTVMVGRVVSRNVMVWIRLVVLPQASVAVHTREITLAPPQPLLTESLKLTVTKLQLSWAEATPVLFVVVFAGHSSVRSAGMLSAGARLSLTVMV